MVETSSRKTRPPFLQERPEAQGQGTSDKTEILAEMTGVSKLYPDPKSVTRGRWALRDIHLSIHKGERIAVVGKSGSGKSTLLNILALLEEGTEGRYRFGDRFPSDQWSAGFGWFRSLGKRIRKELQSPQMRQQMGFVFQTPFMLSNFTVRQNIAMPWWIAHREHAPQERGPEAD